MWLLNPFQQMASLCWKGLIMHIAKQFNKYQSLVISTQDLNKEFHYFVFGTQIGYPD
jgi:hypothetical protein